MIRVGGNSYNNGIRFVGDRYSVSFETHGNSTNMYLRKNLKNDTKKFMKVLRKIPLIRGIGSIICTNKILIAMLLLDLLMHIFPSQLNTNSQIQLLFKILTIVIFGLVLFYFFAKMFRNMKCTWQYHGAEHKVIYTNYAQQEITLENCRQSPRVNDDCGTMFVSIVIATWLLIQMPLMLFDINICPFEQLIVVVAISYEFFLMKRNTPVISLLFKVGYWLQKCLFTREPSNEQLSQAVAAFNLLEKAEMGKLSEDELKYLLLNGKKESILNRVM